MRLRRRPPSVVWWALVDSSRLATPLGGYLFVFDDEPEEEWLGRPRWRALTPREEAWRRWPWDVTAETGISSYQQVHLSRGAPDAVPS